ncbi:SigE family RNA polymerase sigma factor [Actinospica durhamensis]|uniref:RNA polymerase sigma factor n=1 Tax=Actinospica durhamensis TaxID=1508375 RepID=A0A941EV81_9ACTN|nr:SigE family RNA polymerase sigma factor [Actinospica durhamensis]MBR7834544.1 SigE family RNA polymerase sigma factor [Actinospica durhamensis]
MKAAEEERFREFVAIRWPGLLRMAYGLSADRNAAEDLAQATLAKVYASWGRVSRADNQDAYLYSILCNTYRGGFRKRRVAEVQTEFVPEAGQPDAAEHVESRMMLMAAVNELPPKQRAVLLLRYFADLSEAQTAEVMGVSVGTVKSQTSRAIDRLRTSPHLLEGGVR